METELLWVALASFLGALVAAALGWAEASEPFNARKFLASVLRGLVAAAIFAMGFTLVEQVTWFHYIGAFVGGAGIDVLGKRGVAAVADSVANWANRR
ncbi:MAG: hypothetical protein Q8N53_02045 [Longimicrobiales bacterium]|nr:hypothetical protein [Longimicrobiales bacterium]